MVYEAGKTGRYSTWGVLVLILVWMEDGLWAGFIVVGLFVISLVLILVWMEDGLWELGDEREDCYFSVS